MAAVDLAAATDAAAIGRTRVDRIIGLASAVGVGAGEVIGADLAARGEFVGKLLEGQIVATLQYDRQVRHAEEAGRSFGLADARAGFAERGLAAAGRLEVVEAERRAALKTPFRRVVT